MYTNEHQGEHINTCNCIYVHDNESVLQGRDFTIVFRSFGDDISDVVEEMNAFATGQHPSYPEVRSQRFLQCVCIYNIHMKFNIICACVCVHDRFYHELSALPTVFQFYPSHPLSYCIIL